MIEFNAETAALLDRGYRGRDAMRRRHANLHALDPAEGETVLDIGCGTGLLLAEIAAAVGPAGQAIGLDMSADMLAGARAATGGMENVSIVEGGATDLPFDDGSIDRIVSVQVFEYVDDLPAALAECRRVLKPGGRLVIGDWHWDSLVWKTGDPERMARIIAAWDDHFAEREIPALLPRLLSDAGLRHTSSIPVTFVDTIKRADGMAGMMQVLIPDFVRKQGTLPEDDISAWSEELDALATEGAYFFSFTHIVTVADLS